MSGEIYSSIFKGVANLENYLRSKREAGRMLYIQMRSLPPDRVNPEEIKIIAEFVSFVDLLLGEIVSLKDYSKIAYQTHAEITASKKVIDTVLARMKNVKERMKIIKDRADDKKKQAKGKSEDELKLIENEYKNLEKEWEMLDQEGWALSAEGESAQKVYVSSKEIVGSHETFVKNRAAEVRQLLKEFYLAVENIGKIKKFEKFVKDLQISSEKKEIDKLLKDLHKL